MASTVSGSGDFTHFSNSRVMSPCSVKSIEKNLETHTAQCVRKFKHPDSNHMSTKPQEIISLSPGEMIGLRQQCQVSFGPHYGVCPSKEYFLGRDICARVWCKDRTKPRSDPCETRTYFPALDGTECGRTKWCIAGRCVENPKRLQGKFYCFLVQPRWYEKSSLFASPSYSDVLATEKSTSAKLHWRPNLLLISECSDLNEKTCRKYSKAKLRHYCKATDFKEICCRSCEQLKDL
ncbi:hypothetical protein COOONC_10346 [Cooperia oncophora]